MNDDHLPAPVTPLERMAAEHHEMFMCWVRAGFTRAEALQLLMSVNGTSVILGAMKDAQDTDG